MTYPVSLLVVMWAALEIHLTTSYPLSSNGWKIHPTYSQRSGGIPARHVWRAGGSAQFFMSFHEKWWIFPVRYVAVYQRVTNVAVHRSFFGASTLLLPSESRGKPNPVAQVNLPRAFRNHAHPWLTTWFEARNKVLQAQKERMDRSRI